MAALRLRETGRLRVLDFDIEARPLTYLGGDFTTRDITAIAASWVGEKEVCCWLLGDVSAEEMLAGFVALYDQADMVTGHYIRRYDLPNVNWALVEAGMSPLSAKLSQDTKIDLLKGEGVSMSQESLAGMLGVKAPKVHMTQVDWREANRLTPVGLAKTRNRVVGDIRQHKQMRQAALDRRLLRAPRVWSP